MRPNNYYIYVTYIFHLKEWLDDQALFGISRVFLGFTTYLFAMASN